MHHTTVHRKQVPPDALDRHPLLLLVARPRPRVDVWERARYFRFAHRVTRLALCLTEVAVVLDAEVAAPVPGGALEQSAAAAHGAGAAMIRR